MGRGIKAKAEDMGIDLSDDELEEIKEIMREKLKIKGGLTEEEMEILINDTKKGS